MWTFLYNYLYGKIFPRSEINFPFRSDAYDNCVHRKRIKLTESFSKTNILVDRTDSSFSIPMPKNVIEDSDEEECCIIAEIPRRKKVSSFNEPTTSNSKPSGQSSINNFSSRKPTFGSRENSDDKEDSDVQIFKTVSFSSINDDDLPSYTKTRFYSKLHPSVRGSTSSETKSSTEISRNTSVLPFSAASLKMNDHDENDIKIVKRFSSSLNKNGALNFNTKNKFFRSQRAELSHSKMEKSRMSFKNKLKRNISFLQETYRLTEKFQYIQLLQSQTNYNLMPTKTPLKKLVYKPEAIPLIDLTDEKCSKNKESEIPSTSSDEDIIIENKVPEVKSFQDLLKITPVSAKELPKHLLPGQSEENKLLEISDFSSGPITLSIDDTDVEASDNLNSDELEKKWKAFMQITNSKKSEMCKDIEEDYYLPELTSEQENKIQAALEPYPSKEVLVKGFDLTITRRDIQTLKGLNWLNDEIINFYMNLIMDRSDNNYSLPKVYAFNTFFYPKLLSSGHTSLKRWTKQVDIFSFDIILVPVHLGMHWCMSVIDFRSKSVQYYDSIGSSNDLCLEGLLFYLRAESMDKKKKMYSTSDWKKINMKDIPQQMNGSDCGVFSCMFAEHKARDSPILFNQDHMPYFRKKMIIEILEKRLLT